MIGQGKSWQESTFAELLGPSAMFLPGRYILYCRGVRRIEPVPLAPVNLGVRRSTNTGYYC